MTAAVLGGAPAWVYGLLLLLVALGIRRLRTREMRIAVALLPSVAFLAWSVIGAVVFARPAGAEIAALAWLGGASIGTISAIVLPEARGQRLPDGRVRLPGSWVPLLLYIAVFMVRFACGAWTAMTPSQAIVAAAIGIAVGAAMTARLVTNVVRWQPAIPAAVQRAA